MYKCRQGVTQSGSALGYDRAAWHCRQLIRAFDDDNAELLLLLLLLLLILLLLLLLLLQNSRLQ